MLSRRTLLKNAALAAAAAGLNPRGFSQANQIAPGPFRPEYESLKQWRMPDWFRDAKFGLWAHWDAQCVPEHGEWYGRNMYMQGSPDYEFHVKTYGHPTRIGFKDICHKWQAEHWQPEEMMDLYVKAGAKYFVGLGVHHDNLDCWDSKYHEWNTTRVGPKKDIVGTWARIAREHGLRFGVSNHGSHAWHWYQTAYGYDAVGPLAGVRYDAYTQTKADGRGLWWDGLDPQKLYTGRNLVIPDGITTIAAMNEWHEKHDRIWDESAPANNEAFTRNWFLRCQDLVDTYQPDMLYFDDTELPLGQTGLDIVAHYYNGYMARHGGKLDAVVAAKNFKPEHAGAAMLDIERGRAQGLLAEPWQTDTCIGTWHYNRSIFEEHKYKSASSVAQTLIDIVSKNGNLLLSVPVRGDGTFDSDELAFLHDMAGWIAVHGEAIYGTRPFKIYGEGAPDVANTTVSSDFNEAKARPFDATDIRFTRKGETLYFFALGWPADGKLRVRSLSDGNPLYPARIERIQMLGGDGTPLGFTRGKDSLMVTLPPRPPNHLDAFAFRIT